MHKPVFFFVALFGVALLSCGQEHDGNSATPKRPNSTEERGKSGTQTPSIIDEKGEPLPRNQLPDTLPPYTPKHEFPNEDIEFLDEESV